MASKIKLHLVLILCLCSISFSARHLHAKELPKKYFAKTDDNWTLVLYRYQPRSKDYNGKEPLILCHGFDFNSYIWDLDEKHSMARYFQDKGYDVWAVNLRGSGESSKPALSELRSITKMQLENIPQIFLRMPLNMARHNWTIDDHIQHDIPAIIKTVQSETKKEEVVWIGHSMGGMIMYAYLEGPNAANIKGFVALSPMINADQSFDKTFNAISSYRPITESALLINTTIVYQLRNLTMGMLKLPWESLFYNEDNMTNATVRRMFRIAIDDTSPGVIAQYRSMIDSGNFLSVDKEVNYTEDLSFIKTPILLVTGSADKMGSVSTITYAYDHVSSKDKTLHIFSKENGYSSDYGHCDLILGENSKKEVYGYILDWLNSR